MKTYLIIFSTLIFLSNSGCQKTNTISSLTDQLDSLVVRNLYNNNINYTIKYSYDNSGNLKFLNHSNNDQTYTLNYNTIGDLVTSKFKDGSTEIMVDSFIYDISGKIIRKTGTPILPNLQINDDSFTYDSQSRLISDSQLDKQTSTVLSYETYLYDNNDDIIERKFYSISSTGLPVLDGGISYSYDNKLNPFTKIKIPYYMVSSDISNLSKHNVISTSAISGPSLYLSPTTYTYTNNNLPNTAVYGLSSNPDAQRWEFFYH